MGETPPDPSGRPGHRPARRGTTPSAPGSAVLTPPTGIPAVGPPQVPAQRVSPETVPPPPAPAVRTCVCGCPEDTHDHYRAGDDCGACGPRTCPGFRDRADDDEGPVRRIVRRLRG